MEIPISQDIRKYKTKDIGNFSFKEAGFIVIGVGIALLCYNVFHLSMEACILPMGVVLVFGFFRPYGMTFYQFLRTVGKESLTPATYINETDFEYILDDYEELYGKEIAEVTKASAEWFIQNPPVSNKITKNERSKLMY